MYAKSNNGKYDIPLSVVISARNEAENLKANLPSFLSQDYKNYEVVVVNDCSEDDTEMVLAELKVNYPHLRSTTIVKDKKFAHGKKLALTVGIKAAKNEWLVFTDADCKPVSKSWLKEFSDQINDPTEVIIGYGGYEQKPGLLDKFIRFDTLFIAMQYLGAALSGKPYMGVGRNLAYRKTLFFNNKGFSSHSHILSGDDDLFINQVASKKNTTVMLSPDSFTLSIQSTSRKHWIEQKRRHLTTAKYYKGKSKFHLGMELGSRFVFYLLFILLLIYSDYLYAIIGVFTLRLIAQLVVIKSVMKRLNEKDLLLTSPVMDIFMPIINFWVHILNSFRVKRNRWK